MTKVNRVHMIFASNLKKQLDKKRMSVADLARALNLSDSTVRSWYNGEKYPRIDKIQELADFFDVTRSELVDSQANNIVSVKKLVKIPILGTIACGDPILAEQNIEGYVEEPADKLDNGKYFYLHAQGDSMETTIPNGSMVLIREQATVEDGEIAAVLVDGDTRATLKRVHYQGSSVILNADNKNYPPIIINCENPGRIIGKAIRVSIDL